jgi:hypothetical protein
VILVILATALFYGEPCFNARTCAFTDIFNSGYFITVTIACRRVLGTKFELYSLISVRCDHLGPSCWSFLFFSMPLAIVGNTFSETWKAAEKNDINRSSRQELIQINGFLDKLESNITWP